MTEHDAIQCVTSQQRELRIPAEMKPQSAEKSIVEYMKDRTRPGRIEDRIAWVVTLISPTGFVKVHVDDGKGDILEVIRSA